MRRRLWRLLQELFGEPPPPRPTGSIAGPAGSRGHAGVHGERGGDPDEGEALLDAAGGPGPGPAPAPAPGPAGPAPDAGHGHGHQPHP